LSDGASTDWPDSAKIDRIVVFHTASENRAMHWADIIAEQRAAEAVRKGELSGLAGEGAPLDLSEDPLVPPEVRAIYRVLKNAGFAPPEISAMRAVADLEKELLNLPDSDRVARARALVSKIAALREARELSARD